MSRDANTAFARALVDEWARAGITDAALAPGSRSAPLALALAGDDRIRLHVHVDERSAAFFALGTAKASGRPAVVLCTSGTAAAHFHAAVLEAHHSRVPLVVCTADRPPELRDVGAGQTIDQTKLYGDAVRWFFDPGVPEDRPDVGAVWRSLAARAVAESLGPPAGPVHLNLPFREPLTPTGAPLVDAPGRPDGGPWTEITSARRLSDDATVDRIAAAVRAAPRGLFVAGWGTGVTPETAARFARAAGWPVLADPISCLRTGDHTVSTYDALLRVPGFATEHRPDLVVRVGAPPTSKATDTTVLAADVPQMLVDPDRAGLDPGRAAAAVLAVDDDALLAAVADRLGQSAPSEWLDSWLTAERTARRALDELLAEWEEPFEGRVARDVVDALPSGATLLVASSMPVRDVESFARPRDGLHFLANRGVNGIDGFVSTVLGTAAVSDGPVVALLGDLCLLHDANGLLGAADRGIDATLVVLDNDGGGIFSFLPQAELPEHFETLFGTPHGIDLAELAKVHGLPAERIEKASEVVPALEAAVAAGGVSLVIVPTDRADNVDRHRQAVGAVQRAVSR
ncbi:MAG TPA: 2-succinyl-5-enolpyruvyl-6-hydroxy-3-cyclohexene-1-carboxylic-acid synthase [Acidimicrobiia bacterium]|nr:2-succinyl-5-enolpyruvyl-6-hydroxy-3-cyclohexene-1-carboxylic-acid synthase [Acidimicrobiia bacterium]